MLKQMPMFPVHQAFGEIQDYIESEWLSVRYCMVDMDTIIIHIEPGDDIPDDVDVEYMLMEQTDVYADDFAEWFPHLTVRSGARDDDWYIITISQ